MKEAKIFRKAAWETLPVLDIDFLHETESTDVEAHAQICYDDEALYLHLFAKESEIRAEEKGILSMPCNDSCLEFFFSPIEGDLRYLNLEFNSVKSLYMGIATGIEDLIRLPLTDKQKENIIKPEVNFLPDGWEITYQLPYTFIQNFFPDFKAEPGKTIRANFYKCAELTSAPHFLAWSPVTPKERSAFHAPWEFGTLTFAE